VPGSERSGRVDRRREVVGHWAPQKTVRRFGSERLEWRLVNPTRLSNINLPNSTQPRTAMIRGRIGFGK
jgi:hypothetical protein